MKLTIKIIFKEIYRAFFEKNYRQFLKLAFKFGSYSRYTKRVVRFFIYSFIVPDTLSFIWQFKEIFTDTIYAFQTNSSSPVIYDCGANIGTSVVYFKKIFLNSKLKAFEANPQIAEVLCQNIIRNNIKDVEIIKKAVWTNNDGIMLNFDEADSSSIYTNGK